MQTKTEATDLDAYVGARLTELRLQQRETVNSVARALGAVPEQVERWESGTQRIPASSLYDLAELLHCRISSFYGLSTTEDSSPHEHGAISELL